MPTTAGKFVLPRDQARDGARKGIRPSPSHDDVRVTGSPVLWLVILVGVALLGLTI